MQARDIWTELVGKRRGRNGGNTSSLSLSLSLSLAHFHLSSLTTTWSGVGTLSHFHCCIETLLR